MAEKLAQRSVRDLPEVQDPAKVFSSLQEDLDAYRAITKKFQSEGAGARIMRRAKKILVKSKAAEEEIYGEVIAKCFPVKKTQDCVKRLRLDPLDSEARIGLIEPFVMKGIKGNLMVYRQVVLQAMLEANSPKLTSMKLNLALMAQRRYLDKLMSFFKEELNQLHAKLTDVQARSRNLTPTDPTAPQNKDSDPSSKDDSASSRADKQQPERYASKEDEINRQIDETRNKINFLKECMGIVKAKQLGQNLELDLNELASSGEIPKEQLTTIISPFLSAMAALPLARSNAEWLISIVKKGAPRIPIGGFYESRMHRVRSKVFFVAYTAGNKKLAAECGKALFASLNSISATLTIVGNHPSSKFDKACVREYGMITHIVYQQSPLLGFAPPSNHGETMQRAIELLREIAEEPGVPELINVLGKNLLNQQGIGQSRLAANQSEEDAEEE